MGGSAGKARSKAIGNVWCTPFGKLILSPESLPFCFVNLAYGLPQTTTYAYTADGYRWINHENLAELFFAVGYDTFGIVGLQLAQCLVAAFLLGGFVWAARRYNLSVAAISVTAFIVFLNLEGRWCLRPQLFSYALFAITLATRAARSPRRWNPASLNSGDLTISKNSMPSKRTTREPLLSDVNATARRADFINQFYPRSAVVETDPIERSAR